MADDANGNGRSPWVSNIVTGGAVVTILIGLGAAVRDGDKRESERTSEMVIDMQGRMSALDYARGRVDKAIAALELKAVELDTTLQREMRLINDTTVTQIDAIDRRLQGEMKTWVDDLSRRVSELREWSRINREMVHDVREELARQGAKP